VARDRVVEFVSTLAMIAGTLARIADEIRILSRPEFGEVEEAWRLGKVGSSTMPHKRNPERCEQVVVMARLAAAQVGASLAAMIGDHERDSRALRIEWAVVPDISHYTLCAAEITLEIVAGLTIHRDRMRRNVEVFADKVSTEKLMLTLGERIGKQQAHEVVYALSQEAISNGVSVETLFRDRPELVDLVDPAALGRIFQPATYVGSSTELTLAAVARARAKVDQLSPDQVAARR
jgi:adenylosuccinate lyase